MNVGVKTLVFKEMLIKRKVISLICMRYFGLKKLNYEVFIALWSMKLYNTLKVNLQLAEMTLDELVM